MLCSVQVNTCAEGAKIINGVQRMSPIVGRTYLVAISPSIGNCSYRILELHEEGSFITTTPTRQRSWAQKGRRARLRAHAFPGKPPHVQDTERSAAGRRCLRLCHQGVVILPQDLLPVLCVYQVHRREQSDLQAHAQSIFQLLPSFSPNWSMPRDAWHTGDDKLMDCCICGCFWT